MTSRPGFLLCVCPDSTLLRDHIEGVLKAYPVQPSWERLTFWADEELPRTFWDSLTLQGLFVSHRALVLRQAHLLPAEVWKRLSGVLGQPQSSAWVFVCLEVPWEKGQAKIPAHLSKLPCFAFAERQGWVWRSPGLDPRSLGRYIQTRCKELGLILAQGTLEILSATLPLDASAVDSELSRLSLLAGDQPLEPEQVQRLGNGPAFHVFTFLRQLQSGQTTQVWTTLLQEQAKGEELLFYLLVMLQREARQLWQILAGDAVRLPPGDLDAKRQTAHRLGGSGLARMWDYMLEAEESVKSGRCSPAQALDALLSKLTLLFSN